MGRFILKKHTSDVGFIFKKENKIILNGYQHYSSINECQNGLQALIQNMILSNIEDCTTEGSTLVEAPKFSIHFKPEKSYYFKITSTDGKLFADSISFDTKLECINAIDEVIKTIMPII